MSNVTFGDFWELENDLPPLKAAESYASELAEKLPELNIAFVHGKLTVEGNEFRNPCRAGKHVFRFEYLAEADIRGNTFDAPLEVSTHRSGPVTQRDNIQK
jgi:hypothetical protein